LVTLLFSATLVFKETFAFAILRVVVFFATARFAFGRALFGAAVRRFAVDFGEARRAIARDEERLKLLVTALISKVMIERAMWTKRSGSCRGRVT
jgi:hypothetical protein